MKKILLFVLSALFLSANFAHAADSDLDTVAKEFLIYFTSGDSSKALALTDKDAFLDKYLGVEKPFVELTEERAQSIRENLGGVKEITIDKEAVNDEGTEALLDITILYNKTFNGNDAEKGYLFMTKIDGEWKVKYMSR